MAAALPFLMICMLMLFIIGAVWFPLEAKDMLDPLESLACSAGKLESLLREKG
jgi:hypothetical protein